MSASLTIWFSSSTNCKDTLWVSEAIIFSEAIRAYSSGSTIHLILLCSGTRTRVKTFARISFRILINLNLNMFDCNALRAAMPGIT